jgi:hypothetical protein
VASFVPPTTTDKTRYPHHPCLGISKGVGSVGSVGSVDPPGVNDFFGSNPSPVPRDGTISNVRHDVVSEVHRGVVNIQTMVSDIRHMLKVMKGLVAELSW